MDWLIFAFLAPLVWAGCNIIDKFLLSKKFKNPYSYQLWLVSMDAIAIIIISILFPISYNYPGFIIGIIVGIVGVASLVFYNKAMLLEEVSVVMPLTYLNVIFTIPLAFIFLNEVLTLWKYAGVVLLFMGAVLISYRKVKNKKWAFSPAMKYLLVAGFMWSCLNILEKYSLNFIDPFSLFFWYLVGFVMGGLPILIIPRIKNDFINTLKRMDKKVVLLTILNLSFSYSAFNLYFLAMSSGFVTLVSAITSIQPFTVFLYSTTLTVFFPYIIKERINKSTISVKLIAIFLIFIGSCLVST